MLNGLEKIIVVLTVSLVLLAAVCVTGLTFIPIQSGISKDRIDSDMAMIRWLDAQAMKGRGLSRVIQFQDGPRNPGRNQGRPSPLGKGPKRKGMAVKTTSGKAVKSYLQPKPREKVAYNVDYYSDGEDFPDDERVPAIPWLKREYNVVYYRPQQIASSLVEYYQSLEAATQLIKEPKGRFEETVNGTSFTVTAIPKTSYLNTVVGLQPGDKILSVNGQKISGVGFAAAKSIYEQVKGASKFAVKIERQGRVQVLSFTVKKRR